MTDPTPDPTSEPLPTFSQGVIEAPTMDAAIDAVVEEAVFRTKRLAPATARAYVKALQYVFPAAVRRYSVATLSEDGIDVAWAKAVMIAAPSRHPLFRAAWAWLHGHLTAQGFTVPMGTDLRRRRERHEVAGIVEVKIPKDIVALGVRVMKRAGVPVRAASRLEWKKLHATAGEEVFFMGDRGRGWYAPQSEIGEDFKAYWTALDEPTDGPFFPAGVGSKAPLPLMLLQAAYREVKV